jgi:predicted nucleic acid-binding protein
VGVSRIFWDTTLFIYLFEDIDERGEQVARLRERMLERGDQLCTSALTLSELQVKAFELHEPELARQFEAAVEASARVVGFDRAAARRMAAIRAQGQIRPADAIQLACAAQIGTDLFVTNDERLSHHAVPGIQFISSLAAAPL